jgi:hypothetical protein
LAGSNQVPAWLGVNAALGRGLTRLLERIEWLELLRSALGLIHVQALGPDWRTRLVKLANLASVELAAAIEQDHLLAAYPEAFLLLAEILGEPWLTPPAAKRITPLVKSYLADLCATMDLFTGAAVQRPIYDEVAGLLTLSCLSADVRCKAEQFLTSHYPLEDNFP